MLELVTQVEQFAGKPRDKQYLYLDEMLTRNLIKLDNIDTEGKDTIRQARKEAIKCIEKWISILEAKANENQAAELKMEVEKVKTQEDALQDNAVAEGVAQMVVKTNEEGGRKEENVATQQQDDGAPQTAEHKEQSPPVEQTTLEVSGVARSGSVVASDANKEENTPMEVVGPTGQEDSNKQCDNNAQETPMEISPASPLDVASSDAPKEGLNEEKSPKAEKKKKIKKKIEKTETNA